MEGFLFGVLGGLLAEIAGLFKLRQQAPQELPKWLRSPFYWIVTLVMIAAGGGLVSIYSASDMGLLKPILAVNIGASAPLIIGALVSQVPTELEVD
jgi:hypothetical protein